MTLATRPLGTSGIDITPVGLGAWAIGGGDWKYGWGSQDDRSSIAAIRRAVELGINWTDTAAIYGIGHSEEVVDPALREISAGERPLVFTKCGRVADPARPDDEPVTGTTVSAVAIAWTLAWPGVTGAIVGARSPEQTSGWVGGASVRLDADDLAAIAAGIEATGAGSGPTRPDAAI